jgi:hypothetical protein
LKEFLLQEAMLNHPFWDSIFFNSSPYSPQSRVTLLSLRHNLPYLTYTLVKQAHLG